MQTYTDPKRENETYALPDLEVFHMSAREIRSYGKDSCWYSEDDNRYLPSGYYYWACFPGCLPDSDPVGPFSTEAEALADAREGYDDDGEDLEGPEPFYDPEEDLYGHMTLFPGLT